MVYLWWINFRVKLISRTTDLFSHMASFPKFHTDYNSRAVNLKTFYMDYISRIQRKKHKKVLRILL